VRSAALAIGLGLALCLAGAGFAATALYLPGVALLLIAAAATTWVWIAANGVRVVRSVGSPSVEEHAVLPITVSMSRSHVPLPGGEVRAWAGGPALPVSGSGGTTVTTGVRFPRRGRHLLSPASLLVADPLGLCSRAIASTADEVLVLPRVESVRFAAVGSEPTILGRQAVSATDAAATEVDSLRPLCPGTPASRIHWPTVARTATLMERRRVADGDQAPLVVVDPREPSTLDALDNAIRAAASLCVHLARRGGCALLLPGDRRPTPIDTALCGFAECHARLAVLQPEAGAPPLGCLNGANVVLWVTAGIGSAAALGALGAQVRYLVSPHSSQPWPVQFTVAGCAGQRLERNARPSMAPAG
jgi:uncharacterized protein (DUF58 family)